MNPVNCKMPSATDVIAEALRSMDYSLDDPDRDNLGVWEAYYSMAKAVVLILRDKGFVINFAEEVVE